MKLQRTEEEHVRETWDYEIALFINHVRMRYIFITYEFVNYSPVDIQWMRIGEVMEDFKKTAETLRWPMDCWTVQVTKRPLS